MVTIMCTRPEITFTDETLREFSSTKPVMYNGRKISIPDTEKNKTLLKSVNMIKWYKKVADDGMKSIECHVLDTDNIGVEGASIVLKQGSETKFEATSGKEGIITIPEIAFGTYTVTVSKVGYTEDIKTDVVIG